MSGKFYVEICKGGKMAIDDKGNLYELNQLVIPLQQGTGERKYNPADKFFRTACPPGTEHKALLLAHDKIDIW